MEDARRRAEDQLGLRHRRSDGRGNGGGEQLAAGHGPSVPSPRLTRDELDAALAAANAAVLAAVDAGDLDEARRQQRRAVAFEELIALTGDRGLPGRDRTGSNRGSMLASPAARRRSAGVAETPLVRAALERGYTLRSLAETLKCSHALLSQAASGRSSISADLAKRVEKLIGVPADRAHWPKLRS